MSLSTETKHQLMEAGWSDAKIAEADLAHDRRTHGITITLTRDEWNAIAEALTWQHDTQAEEEDPNDWLLAIRDRILSSPGVH